MQTHKPNNLHLSHAQWLRADFHLHTRADKEFKYSGDENSFVAAYVDVLVRLDMITNYNKLGRRKVVYQLWKH